MRAVAAASERAFETLLELRDPLYSVAVAVKHMEDSGVLNAGVGSVPTLEGLIEMDAGLMSSEGLVGAVAAVRYPRNPVLLAYMVAIETPHVLLAGSAADELAEKWGLERHPGLTDEMLSRYVREKVSITEKGWRLKTLYSRLQGFDTVGAVAKLGDSLAAATSTGGIFMKMSGRVGDTPIPGAGFYATSRVACSSTGIGETIILSQPCRLLDMLIDQGFSLEEAAAIVIARHTRVFGRDTLGFIAVDRRGNVVAALNTRAMPIAVVCDGERRESDLRM